MRDKKHSKTMIIFGAGFSKYAKFPLQNDILSELSIFYKRESITPESKENWTDLCKFFKKNIGDNIEKYLIEDLFTILDKCISDNEYFKFNDTKEIEDAKNHLIFATRDYFNQITKEKFNDRKNYQKYIDFAKLLLEQRYKNGNDDKLSIISLNWDCFFERIIDYYSSNYKKTEIDYCTYDYSFNNKETTPSILKKAKGYKNLKILKLHGSTNWGYCPNCHRLYISSGKKMNSKTGETGQRFQCIKYCNKKFSKSINLIPVLITPTFLKDLNNYHLKNIWNNAGIELEEADKIIIIGYSLRPEDFYFRFLLSKNINFNNKNIFVIDSYDNNSNMSESDFCEEVKTKYYNFLQMPKENVEIETNGWENNLDKIKELINN